MVGTCDPRSYELAEYFLATENFQYTKDDIMSLALEIQTAVEDWLENWREAPPPADAA